MELLSKKFDYHCILILWVHCDGVNRNEGRGFSSFSVQFFFTLSGVNAV